MFRFLQLSLLLSLAKTVILVDYCELQSTLCIDGFPNHIACEPNSTFPLNEECLNVQIFELNNDLKNFIVYYHNKYRNMVAGGELENFPKAKEMRELHWDDELAFVAKKHALQCQYMHDFCRGTEEYPYAGQNIAFHESKPGLPAGEERLRVAMDQWFEEYKHCGLNVIKNYDTALVVDPVEHFTMMIHDESDAIGCAYITYEKIIDGLKEHGHMITCNYALNNLLDEPIYHFGVPCSGCKKLGKTWECSKSYSNLCTNVKHKALLSNITEEVTEKPTINNEDTNVIEIAKDFEHENDNGNLKFNISVKKNSTDDGKIINVYLFLKGVTSLRV